MKTFLRLGDVFRYTNGTGSAIASGAVVLIGALLGIAVNAVANGSTGPVRTVGVVKVTKDGTYAWTEGCAIWWDATNSRFTSQPNGTFAGLAAEAAGASATSGELLLNVGNDPGVTAPIADPGDAGAIPVVGTGYVPLVSGGAETRTLAAPDFVGQQLALNFHTDAGDVVVTCATTVNQTGNNTLTFADAGDQIVLMAGQSGATVVWRVQSNDGVALSTV